MNLFERVEPTAGRVLLGLRNNAVEDEGSQIGIADPDQFGRFTGHKLPQFFLGRWWEGAGAQLLQLSA